MSTTPVADWFRAARGRLAPGLLAVAVAAIVTAVTLFVRSGTDYLSIGVWACGVAVIVGGAGLWALTRQDDVTDAEARLFGMGLGGGVGLLTALLGLALGWRYWAIISQLVKSADTAEAWKVVVALTVLLGGLALMFASLMLGRGQERANPLMRRLLYGYNTVLVGFLGLMILVVVNVLAALQLTRAADFTANRAFSLDAGGRSQAVLRGLEQPVKIYLIMFPDEPGAAEMRTLLNLAEDVTNKVKVEYLPPDARNAQTKDLAEKFPVVTGSGVLLVSGDDPKSQKHSFIKAEDLESFDRDPRTGRPLGGRKFLGEVKLIEELSFLNQGKVKPILYVTQGHGELGLDDMGTGEDQGFGQLRQRLNERNYESRALNFDPLSPSVPDDAAVVIIPGPKERFTTAEVEALRRYLSPVETSKRKGKLLVFLEPHRDATTGRLKPTGLEELITENGVQLSDERVLRWSVGIGGGRLFVNDPPDEVIARPRPETGGANPLLTRFKDKLFKLIEPRMVKPAESPNPSGPRAEVLLETVTPPEIVYTEADAKKSAQQSLRDLAQVFAAGEREMIRGRLNTTNPVSLAVTVTADETPRMVVFGDATIISNQAIDPRVDAPNFDLVAGALDWLRERPADIGIQPRTIQTFSLDPGTSSARMAFLPLLLLVFGIACLGGGVWVVRRT